MNNSKFQLRQTVYIISAGKIRKGMITGYTSSFEPDRIVRVTYTVQFPLGYDYESVERTEDTIFTSLMDLVNDIKGQAESLFKAE